LGKGEKDRGGDWVFSSSWGDEFKTYFVVAQFQEWAERSVARVGGQSGGRKKTKKKNPGAGSVLLAEWASQVFIGIHCKNLEEKEWYPF